MIFIFIMMEFLVVVPEHVALVMEGIVLQYCTAACTALVFFRLAKEIFFFCSDKNANNKEKLIKPLSLLLYLLLYYILFILLLLLLLLYFIIYTVRFI